jgi:hypothetical protein
MMARRLVPIVLVLALLIPGAAVSAGSTPAGQGNNQHDPDDRGAPPYFKNLKARLDAYSERQLDEMDKYQNRAVS